MVGVTGLAGVDGVTGPEMAGSVTLSCTQQASAIAAAQALAIASAATLHKGAPAFVQGAGCHFGGRSSATFGSFPEYVPQSPTSSLPVLADMEPQFMKLTMSSLPLLDTPSAPSSSKPRYVGQSAAGAESDDQRSRDIFLRGLPNRLCVLGALEAVLRSAGLSEAVETAQVTRKSSMSLRCAVIRARTTNDVAELAKFFKCRKFGGASPIMVSLSLDQKRDVSLKSLRGGLQHLKQPLKIDVEACSSSGSTTYASPRSLASEPATPHPSRCSIEPPPGLELYASAMESY